MCWLYWNLGASVSWNPQGVFRPVMGLLRFTVILADDIQFASVHTWRRSYEWGTFCDWLQNGTVCVLQKRLLGLVVQSELIEYLYYVYGSVHRWSILIVVQRDATQSSLFIILQVHFTCFGCQPLPSSGVHKTPSNVAKLAWPRWTELAAQKIRPVPEAVVTVLCTPDDRCCWHPKHVEWTCRIINRLLCVASRWTIINIIEYHYITRQQNVYLKCYYAVNAGNLIRASALNNRHRLPLLPSALVGCGGGRTLVMWCTFDARGSR